MKKLLFLFTVLMLVFSGCVTVPSKPLIKYEITLASGEIIEVSVTYQCETVNNAAQTAVLGANTSIDTSFVEPQLHVKCSGANKDSKHAGLYVIWEGLATSYRMVE